MESVLNIFTLPKQHTIEYRKSVYMLRITNRLFGSPYHADAIVFTLRIFKNNEVNPLRVCENANVVLTKGARRINNTPPQLDIYSYEDL